MLNVYYKLLHLKLNRNLEKVKIQLFLFICDTTDFFDKFCVYKL